MLMAPMLQGRQITKMWTIHVPSHGDHQINGHEFEQTLGDSGRTGRPGMLQSMGSLRVGHD